ncbi:MAG TPA: hypothetical protein GXX47_08565 [Firmicutes bacterium]|nr:hypothetical protein [Bacillota bacterium]
MQRFLVRVKALTRDEKGHASTVLLISLGLVMVFAAGIYIVSEAAVAKIRVQNAADAAALAGAGLLADCMDLLVFANYVGDISLLFSLWGSPIRAVINALKNEVIRYGPAAANARAIQVGLANEAVITPVHWPDLGVERIFLGYVRDRLNGRTGNRFVQVAAAQELRLPRWVKTFLGRHTPSGLAVYPTATARGIVQGRGMLVPHYVSGLGKVD